MMPAMLGFCVDASAAILFFYAFFCILPITPHPTEIAMPLSGESPPFLPSAHTSPKQNGSSHSSPRTGPSDVISNAVPVHTFTAPDG